MKMLKISGWTSFTEGLWLVLPGWMHFVGQNQFLLVGRGDSDRSGWAAFGRLVLNEKTPRVTPDSHTALHSV